jgi:Tfp pilus assembly major pilin PilA
LQPGDPRERGRPAPIGGANRWLFDQTAGGGSMKRQKGITLIGFIFVLIIAAFFIYTAMKLVPAYMDYFNVAKALNTVATNSTSGNMTVEEVQRQLDLQQLSQYFSDSDIKAGNISVVTDPNGGTSLKLSYDKKISWIYNIDFLVHFQKSVPIKVSAAQE